MTTGIGILSFVSIVNLYKMCSFVGVFSYHDYGGVWELYTGK